MNLKLNLIEIADDFFDTEGVEVSTVEEARKLAMRAAREIMAAQLVQGFFDTSPHINVTDEHGNVVATVPFADVFVRGNA